MSDKKEGIFKHPVIFSLMAVIALIEFIRMSLFLTFLPDLKIDLHYGIVADH